MRADMRLHDLAVKYNSDKLHFHSYISFYEVLFASLFTKRQCKYLLEIGIGYEQLMAPLVPQYTHGSSLRMWEEYFPHARIYACDIREDTLVNEGRIRSVVADQTKAEDLTKLLKLTAGGWDVVIDDGSHQTADQILTASELMKYVSYGGVYVIEDVMEPEKVAEGLVKYHPQVFKFDKRCDDNLVVVKR